MSDAYHLLLSKYFETIAQPKHKIDILYNKLLILYNLLYKWEEYMEIVKASTEVVNYYMSIEKKGSEFYTEKEITPKKKKKKEGEQLSADEEVTSASEGEQNEQNDETIDLEKESSLSKRDMKKIKEDMENMRVKKKEDDSKTGEQEGRKEPMQKLLDDLFEKVGRNFFKILF